MLAAYPTERHSKQNDQATIHLDYRAPYDGKKAGLGSVIVKKSYHHQSRKDASLGRQHRYGCVTPFYVEKNINL